MARPKTVLPPASPDDIEQQFYEALQRGEIDALMAVWADDEDVCCISPGGPRLIGPAAIRAGFERIFSHGTVPVRPERVKRLQGPSCSVHSVIEHVEVLTAEGPREAWVVATNVYVLGPQGWRLVAHHASPGSGRELQDEGEPAAVLH